MAKAIMWLLWLLNLIQIVEVSHATATGYFIVKCLGVLMPPLGAIMGLVGVWYD